MSLLHDLLTTVPCLGRQIDCETSHAGTERYLVRGVVGAIREAESILEGYLKFESGYASTARGFN